MKNKELKKIANTIRGLSIDAIQKANSGHPGLPLGMADVASVLFSEYLNFNPDDTTWINRDRFVLSGGHGSMLLYSLLHLFGYDVSLDDLKNFRQWGSKTPGHPEYRLTPGVETTTGPLGQGLANAVGMAWGESHLSAITRTKSKFGKGKERIIDHYTYVFAGDGDMEEGISHEVCSLAGHWGLDKLIVFYDYNNITIDGALSLSSSDDVRKRFESYGWHVLEIDGNNYKSIKTGIAESRKLNGKPKLIITNTTIGFGSPNKAGTSSVHGSPLGIEEIKLTKENLGIPQKEFFVSEEVKELCRLSITEKLENYNEWQEKYKQFSINHKKKSKLLNTILNGQFDEDVFALRDFDFPQSIATRSASLKVLERIFDHIPSLIGGSADLTPSNKTKTKTAVEFNKNDKKGRYIHFGIREHGMGAIMNGISLYNGFIPYGGTFLVFSDYMRPAIRMAALMEIGTIFVFTHDSIGLGEDGPTHQPIEQLNALRMIPNNIVFRPMDANETAIAWKMALKNRKSPVCIALSRQNLPVYLRKRGAFATADKAEFGGYVLTQDKNYNIILIASGSEVQIAVEAKKMLNQRGIKVRVVSMPSQELFDRQPNSYKNQVIHPKCKNIIAIEAGNTMSWKKYVGDKGLVIGTDHFGASAPYDVLYKKYGLTAENVAQKAVSLIKSNKV